MKKGIILIFKVWWGRLTEDIDPAKYKEAMKWLNERWALDKKWNVPKEGLILIFALL